MHSRAVLACLLAVLGLMALVAVPSPSLAQGHPVDGVDLFILIDQSGSMSGTPENSATDPNAVRISTAQYLVEYLHFDGVYVNEYRHNRVAIIGFGSPDRTHSMVDLMEVETASDVEHAQSLIDTENLGNTSFISALREVKAQSPEDDSGTQRQKIIVIVTDGGPYDERSERETNPFTYGNYFSEIYDYYHSELGAEAFPMYVVGIDRANLYWSNVVRYWEQIAGEGHAVRVQEVEETNREIVRVLCPLMNPDQPREYCALADLGPHFVHPYARMVQFSFFKYDPAAEARLYRPGDYPGSPVTASDPDVDYQTTTNKGHTRDEIYRVSDPVVGCWLTDREGTGQVDVFVQVAFHRMHIVTPVSAHPEILPLSVELELLDDQGQPVDELAGYPIDLVTVLSGDHGQTHSLDVQRTGAGRYASTVPVLVRESGLYTLTLEGYTTLTSSPSSSCITNTQEVPVFQHQAFQIVVSEPYMELLAPVQPYVRYGPISGLTLGFYDTNGKYISVPQDAPWTMTLTAETPSGDSIALPNPSWDGGHFTVREPFFLEENGEYLLVAHLLDGTGQVLHEYQTHLLVQDNMEIIVPGADHPAYSPIHMVEVELRDAQNRPIEADSDYPLRLVAEIAGLNGMSELVELEAGDEIGRYSGLAGWTLEEPGPYVLSITGTTSMLPGEPESAAFVHRKNVNVSGNLPYYRVVSPDETLENEVYPLHYWFLPPLGLARRPLPVRVELRYGTQPADAREFFSSDPNRLFELAVQGPTTPTLMHLPAIADGQQVFGTELSELRSPGSYTATLRLVGSMRGNVPAVGAWPAHEITFHVRDPLAYTIVWWFVLSLMAAGIVVWTGWQVINRFVLPPARGTLIMERVAGGQIQSIPLIEKHRNHLKVRGQDIGNLLQLKEIRARRLPPLEKGRVGSDQAVEGIEVIAYTRKGERIQGELYAERVRGRQNTLRRPAMKTTDGDRYQFRYEN